MKKIGVNGFGRIGRYFTRITLENPNANVVVVNDLADINALAILFKYDSVHGRLKHKFTVEGNKMVFENGKQIHFFSEKNPQDIPWKEHDVEVVLESTGIFRTHGSASQHLDGGAKRVVISAPAKDESVNTFVFGVNDALLKDSEIIISNASCTTNCAAPMFKVMNELCEIDTAHLITVHSYTSDQRLHDSPHSDLRRARAAALSIIPTSTGAADALVKIFPKFKGRLGGSAYRVPVPDGSMTDMTFVVNNPPSVDEINAAMKNASKNELKGILDYTEDPIVSADIVGDPHSCIFDSELTTVVGNLVRIVGWYDNEAGYANRCVDLILKL